MFRTILLVLGMLVALPASSFAQTSYWVESYNKWNRDGEHTAQVDGQVIRQVNKSIGIYTWWLVSEGWAEAIVGLALSPNQSVTIEIGTGVETDEDPSRLQIGLWTGNAVASLYSVFEVGGSGQWYLVQGNINVIRKSNARVGVGFRSQRFVGIGPRVEIGFPKLYSTFWVSGPMTDPEVKGSRNWIFGVKLTP